MFDNTFDHWTVCNVIEKNDKKMKLKDEVGMTGSKSSQTRCRKDNQIHDTSLRLIFELN